jgi:hypothetical protein
MHRIGLFVLAAVIAGAQNNNPFNKPPADVDAALRERIKEFYDLHVKAQFRKADELVAEDTKDYYFESKKPQYLSYEISRIDYFENFTKAKAVIMCEMYVMMPGFNDKPMKMPTPSAWKMENGKWYWYVDQAELRNSPFGPMKGGPQVGAGQPAPQLGNINMNADFLLEQIKANKNEIEIWPGDSDDVLLVNTAPGMMTLSLLALPDGIEAKLDKVNLQSKETATLKIKTAKDAQAGVVTVQVEQTGQRVPVQVKLKQEKRPGQD